MSSAYDMPGADRVTAALYRQARADFNEYGRLLLSTESEFMAAGLQPPRHRGAIPIIPDEDEA